MPPTIPSYHRPYTPTAELSVRAIPCGCSRRRRRLRRSPPVRRACGAPYHGGARGLRLGSASPPSLRRSGSEARLVGSRTEGLTSYEVKGTWAVFVSENGTAFPRSLRERRREGGEDKGGKRVPYGTREGRLSARQNGTRTGGYSLWGIEGRGRRREGKSPFSLVEGTCQLEPTRSTPSRKAVFLP